jgi:enamine deaminase RidA (YjgF/YER057c/UK114 family)
LASSIAQAATRFGTETYLAMEAPRSSSTEQAMEALFGEYGGLLREHGLAEESEVMLRFHLSDVANQTRELERLLAARGGSSFRSWVGQPPVSGSKCALEAYHIRAEVPVARERQPGGALLLRHGRYWSLWARCLPEVAGEAGGERTVEGQTQELFQSLSRRLEANGMAMRESLLRTWIYLRDVDRNYLPFVEARRRYFGAVARVEQGHYPASTGIEGDCADASRLLFMDSLAVAGLAPGQVRPLEALEHLCHPGKYQVTFERAVQVTYGDRSHCYISGTASVDRVGQVLHVGDVQGQVGRTLENIEALLDGIGAALGDLKILVVYLRDPADHRAVASLLEERLPATLPRILVRGKVCRPEWLVEMDGVAVKGEGDPRYPPYC